MNNPNFDESIKGVDYEIRIYHIKKRGEPTVSIMFVNKDSLNDRKTWLKFLYDHHTDIYKIQLWSIATQQKIKEWL